MNLFSPLRQLVAMFVVLTLTAVLSAETPGGGFAQKSQIAQIGNTLYLGQSLRTDKSEQWQTRLWAAPYGNWEHRQTDADSAGFRADTFGVTAGFHRRWNSHLTWGWGAGGSWISANSDNRSGSKNIDAFKTMFDATLEDKDWCLQLTAGYGHNDQRTERNGWAGQFGGNNSAEIWGIRSEFRYKVGTGLFEMEPFAGLDYMTLSEKGYTEHLISDVGQPQHFDRSSEDSIASTLGMRLRWHQTGQWAVWRPELTVAWFHEFGSDRVFRSSRLDPFPTLYTFPASRQPRDHLLFQVGIVAQLGTSMDVFVRYASDFAGDDSSHAILCGTYWKF